jgi:hypothetical protein
MSINRNWSYQGDTTKGQFTVVASDPDPKKNAIMKITCKDREALDMAVQQLKQKLPLGAWLDEGCSTRNTPGTESTAGQRSFIYEASVLDKK